MSNILDKLNKKSTKFNKTEKKIVDYILLDVEKVLEGSITDFAQSAGVSPASITRFSNLLGYNGYKDLKLALARAKTAQTPYYYKSMQYLSHQVGKENNLGNEYLNQVVSSIAATYNNISSEDILKAVEMIKFAKQVKIFGVAISGFIAQDFAIRLFRLGINAQAVVDSHFQKISASLASEDDVVICISHTGRSVEILNIAKIARNSKAKIICLTAPFTPLSKEADILLNVNIFEEIDIYTPNISQFSYHYIVGLLTLHIGQSKDLNTSELLQKIKAGLNTD